MNVNVNLKQIVVALVLTALIGSGVWWYIDTEPQRKADAGIETMIKFAQKQALEIAIIEQAVKLQNYKQQIAKVQQLEDIQMREKIQRAKTQPLIPAVVDPKDIGE